MSNRRLDNGNAENWSDWRVDIPNMNQTDVPSGKHARHAVSDETIPWSVHSSEADNIRASEVGYPPASGYADASDQVPHPSRSVMASGRMQYGYPPASDYAPASAAGTSGPHVDSSGFPQASFGAPASHAGGHVSVIQDPNDPNSVIIRTRKKKRKKSHKAKKKMKPALKVLLIVIAALVAVVAAAGIALAIAINQGNLNVHRLFSGSEELSKVEGAKTDDDGQIVEYKGHTYKYNENIASVVLIGHDDQSSMGYTDRSLADTIVLFTIDTATNKVRATVVPRNSWVTVDLYDDEGNRTGSNEMQITLSHGVKLPPEGCAANTTSAVARVFYDMPIHYYFDFGREAVEKATKSVGGVQVEALEAIPGEDYSVGEAVLLEGSSAYRYVQYREKDKDESALDRQNRQVQFIKAFAAKVASMGPQGVYNVYTSASDDIVSNLGASEVAYLASCFALGDNADLEIASLKGTTKVGREADGIEYERYYLDEDSVMENTLAAFYTQID